MKRNVKATALITLIAFTIIMYLLETTNVRYSVTFCTNVLLDELKKRIVHLPKKTTLIISSLLKRLLIGKYIKISETLRYLLFCSYFSRQKCQDHAECRYWKWFPIDYSPAPEYCYLFSGCVGADVEIEQVCSYTVYISMWVGRYHLILSYSLIILDFWTCSWR